MVIYGIFNRAVRGGGSLLRRILLYDVFLLMGGITAAKYKLLIPGFMILAVFLLSWINDVRCFPHFIRKAVNDRDSAYYPGTLTDDPSFPVNAAAEQRKKIALGLIFCYILGAGLYINEDREVRAAQSLAGEGRRWKLPVLSSEDRGEKGVRFVCELPEGKGRIRIVTFQKIRDAEFLPGKTVSFYAAAEVPEPASNPHCYDQAQDLRSRGIWLTGLTESVRTGPARNSLSMRLRNRIITLREKFFSKLPGTESEKALLRGILFGDTENLDEDIEEDFRTGGIAHVLAVSGLHIGVLYGFYQGIKKKFSSPVIDIVFWVFLFIYSAMTLFAVSVLRAVFLLIIKETGTRTDRRYDLLTALAAAAGILVIYRPSVMFGASFQLSFLAVFAMGILVPRLALKLPGGIASAIGIQAGLLPYMMYLFNQAPLLAFIWNVPVLFLTGILVPLGACSLGIFACGNFLSGMTGRLSVIAGKITGFLFHITTLPLPGLSAMLEWTGRTAACDGRFTLMTPSAPAWVLVCFYGFLFFLSSETFEIMRLRKSRREAARAFLVLIAVTALVFTVSTSPFDKADIVMVDVGQGDCVHLKLPGRTDVMIDGGGKVNTNIGDNVLKPYLLKNGRSDLDLALVTHLHTDHYKGIQELTQVFPVRDAVTEGVRGDRIRIGDTCTVELLAPEPGERDEEDENRNSLIFRITVKGVTMLVTGDLSEEGERMLLERYRGTGKLRADILKVGHHGSRFSSCEEFLAEVRPEVALIGVGKDNTYGHPTKEALDRLEKAGAKICRTDEDGAIGIRIKEDSMEICTMK